MTLEEISRSCGITIHTDQKGSKMTYVRLNGKTLLRTQNPIEAWTVYIQQLDIIQRRRLQAWCRRNGRCPLTGEME